MASSKLRSSKLSPGESRPGESRPQRRRRGGPRVHLMAAANPLSKDLGRLACRGLDDYLALCAAALPSQVRLTANRKLLAAEERPLSGGRSDDRARAADLNAALADPQTRVIVSASGGAWLTRILPQLDFEPLRRRAAPLWFLGFSEITTLVNHVAAYAQGRGVYWLCPNYLAWKYEPPAVARAAFAEFWRLLPALWGDAPGPGGVNVARAAAAKAKADAEVVADTETAVRRVWAAWHAPLTGQSVAGRVSSGRVRLIGGCLSVLAAMLAGPLARRLRPDGRWLILEDLKEEPYRVDRYLAALKLAGWFERLAGVIVGDFHTRESDLQAAVVALLRYHLPERGGPAVVVSTSFGHRWPISPVLLNRPLRMMTRGRQVEIEPALPLAENQPGRHSAATDENR